jgi:hypothetical protein
MACFCDDFSSMTENPQMQQMMQSVISNPAMTEMSVNSDPQMRAMIHANPYMQHMLQTPSMPQVFFHLHHPSLPSHLLRSRCRTLKCCVL